VDLGLAAADFCNALRDPGACLFSGSGFLSFFAAGAAAGAAPPTRMATPAEPIICLPSALSVALYEVGPVMMYVLPLHVQV
jgi:hypothetical protein